MDIFKQTEKPEAKNNATATQNEVWAMTKFFPR